MLPTLFPLFLFFHAYLEPKLFQLEVYPTYVSFMYYTKISFKGRSVG